MSRLTEISEAAAPGTVAAAYADIRRVTGVPFVVFIYRVLAAEPGRLEQAWGDLAPNLASAEGLTARAEIEAARLPAAAGSVSPLPKPVLDAAGLDPAAVAATLAGFRQANSANIVGLWALLDGVEGRAPAPPGPAQAAAAMVAPGMPMADLATLPAATVALLEEMSAAVAGAERPLLVPSLFRTFAHDHALLEALWQELRPVLEGPEFAGAVAGVAARGRVLAQSLPYPVRPLADPAIRDVITRFLRAIPSMLLTGQLLGTALRAPRDR
jgi:hypothetical protein